MRPDSGRRTGNAALLDSAYKRIWLLHFALPSSPASTICRPSVVHYKKLLRVYKKVESTTTILHLLPSIAMYSTVLLTISSLLGCPGTTNPSLLPRCSLSVPQSKGPPTPILPVKLTASIICSQKQRCENSLTGVMRAARPVYHSCNKRVPCNMPCKPYNSLATWTVDGTSFLASHP